MIRFRNVALRRGRYLLFEGFSADIHDGEKVGLIGDNGTGKSSLFEAVLGRIDTDSGNLEFSGNPRIAHVAQQAPDGSATALDHVLDGDREYRKIERLLSERGNGRDQAGADLYGRMEDIDGYSAPARATRLLSGLGFPVSIHAQPCRTFSGGWRVRLNLAQALMGPSEILLLDEPTNHLDLDAIVWLEEWLRGYAGSLIVVSHDRAFIDACCRRILHIENSRIRSYTGNYSDFERQRAARLESQQALHLSQQRRIAHMEDYIRRFRYKADKARQAQSRIKALEKLKRVAPAHVHTPFSFRFSPCSRVSDPMLTLDRVDAGYGNRRVLESVDLSISGGDRIGLLGINGAGKSTLMKVMAGELDVLSGARREARNLQIGYFAQHQVEQLDLDLTPLQQFQRRYPSAATREARDYLGGFDFRGDKAREPISLFSGGERARLVLALLIHADPNLLILDEPTNHLDMEMRHALGMAIQSYTGAIILVSHDRRLLDSVADRLMIVDGGRVAPFMDDLDAYIRLLRQSFRQPASEDSATTTRPQTSRKALRRIQAQRRQQLKPKRDSLQELENRIDRLQALLQEVQAVLNDPATYEQESTMRIRETIARQDRIRRDLHEAEARWLQASEELEQIERQLEPRNGKV